MSPPLPRPLVRAIPPEKAPDEAAEVALGLLVSLRDRLVRGEQDAALLERARFEIYRQASLSWDDHWRVARVADLEEWTAEAAVQRDDLETAWHAWRAAWWVRHLGGKQGGTELWAHSDHVMALLRRATGRED